MDEVKIWSIEDTGEVVALDARGEMATEWSLEDTLVKNPGLLMPGLTLVGRQTPTDGGPLDLLGVDSDGKLAVFELKRGALSRDAVAQIIDYASDLDGMELGALAGHISERSGEHGISKIEDFEDRYSRLFPDLALDSLKPLRLFLVGLGVDDRTERMVNFLANSSGMDISLITFHGFTFQGKTLLAKQVHVDATDRSPLSGRYVRSVGSVENRAKEVGAYDLLADVRQMFFETWERNLRQAASTVGLTFSVLEQSESGRRSTPTYLALRLDLEDGGIRVGFYPRAIELCRTDFEQLEGSDVPSSRLGNPQALPLTGQVNYQIEIPLKSFAEWETHKETLASLTQAVYEAWLSSDEEPAAHD